MRYELYEEFESLHIFICESDSFDKILEKQKGNCIIIDNKAFTVNCNFSDDKVSLCDEKLKDLVFACKLAKACDDIKEITDDYVRIIDEKEKSAKEECDLFCLNMK